MDSYTYIPNIHVLFDRISAVPQAISYGEAPFKSFIAREVFVDGKPKGEYHIKLNNPTKINIAMAIHFFSDSLRHCEIKEIDPTGTLNLEYHIYIITKDEMNILSMMGILENLSNTAFQSLK